jgi:hypothetical protein
MPSGKRNPGTGISASADLRCGTGLFDFTYRIFQLEANAIYSPLTTMRRENGTRSHLQTQGVLKG